MDGRSKALILLSVVAVAAILGSVVLSVYSADNGEESGIACTLTYEQREAIRLRVQEMREAGASPNEIRAEMTAMLQEFGLEAPKCLGPRAHWYRARRVWWFLNNSEPVELEGTAVALFRDMLIVITAEGQIRIHLPRAWTVDGELTMRGELFESGYLSKRENITVKALRADVIDKEGLGVYLLLGYEIIDESNVHAVGVLPFNIET